MRKYYKSIFGFFVASFFVWVVIKNIDGDELIKALLGVDISYVIAAVFIFFMGYACRIERWRLMLSLDNDKLNWSQCAGPLMASVSVNNVLPLRAGDIIRALAFNKRLGIDTSTSVLSLFIERMLDLLTIILLFGAGLFYFGIESSKMIGVGGVSLFFICALILIVLIKPNLFQSISSPVVDFIEKYFPVIGARLRVELNKISASMAYMSKASTMSKLVAFSFLAWVCEGLVFWLVALSMSSISNNVAAWLALPVGTLTTVIPSTPGYVGTFDYFTAKVMSSFGNSISASTAYALIVHLVLWLPSTAVGGLYMLYSPIDKKALERDCNGVQDD
ncbi:lysylphosphatidylglycerol synthase transmembrane domain-containing protein [Vibrio sp. V03_P4A6T147]|uniref:lysylphosphatidylglycerol synthase transmembrane domain-containing protein n=1 Tax=Vibrio sp. V03_P4A6T147 TaxID=1938658 RepID=UPI000B8EBFB0|nr:lysylphosphatidylglycerol synthetase [Vibrio sp. V03_P4A6T147]